MPPAGCTICRIIAGTEPCHAVYADDRVLAFLSPAPINPGHTILAPRRHIGGLTGLEPADLAHLMGMAPHLAQAIARALDFDGYNLHLADGGCAGQSAEHAHLHIIPRLGTDGFYWNWRALPPDPERPLDDVAATIRKRLPRARRLQAMLGFPDASE